MEIVEQMLQIHLHVKFRRKINIFSYTYEYTIKNCKSNV